MAKPSIDLMILGALKERPMSAYEMDRLFEARAVRRWVRVSAPSIYRNLLRLREEGLVDGREEKGETAPPKTAYAITEAGTQALLEEYRRLKTMVQDGNILEEELK